MTTENTPTAVDKWKLRFKIGNHEFEGEGPEKAVREGLAEFQRLINTPSPTGQSTPQGHPSPAPPPANLLFLSDKGTQALTLRVLPSTDQGVLRQLRNTLLLVLYGYKRALQTEEVPALWAARSVRQSGLVGTKRLSHAFLALQKEGLALKVGRGKGTRYQASQKGLDAAAEIFQTVLKRAGISV